MSLSTPSLTVMSSACAALVSAAAAAKANVAISLMTSLPDCGLKARISCSFYSKLQDRRAAAAPWSLVWQRRSSLTRKPANSPLPAGRQGRLVSVGDERTVAVLERPEGFFRRDSGTQDVVVARIFGLFGLLDLEQIGRVDLAAVDADIAFAEQRVVGRHLLHLGDHGFAVGCAFESGDRFQVMQGRGIDAGLVHARELARPLGL